MKEIKPLLWSFAALLMYACTLSVMTIKNSENIDVKNHEGEPVVENVGNTQMKAKLEVNVGTKKDTIIK